MSLDSRLRGGSEADLRKLMTAQEV